MPAATVELRSQRLSRSFGDRAVLRGIDLTIRTGEVVAIVGGSGSGKTVLLDHLVGLLRPDSGHVLAADHNEPPDPAGQWPLIDLAATDSDRLDQLRLHWSVVFQRNALFSGTVRENIALWLREHTMLSESEIEVRIRASLAAVRLEVADVIDKDREALSGGMAKRVAIARAIAADPIVIFYDEPTTGLDPVVSGHIQELIWDLHRRPVGPRPTGPRVEPSFWDRLADAAATISDAAGVSPVRSSAARVDGSDKRRSDEPRPVPATGPQPPRTTVIVTHDKELLRRLSPRVVMLDSGRICFDGPYERFGKDDCEPARRYLETMPVLHARR
ncbi:MAG: ATP-binding cassette domain-containing protein [Phycisphaeraceae bacterium]|nr:ATP-binding cassette domain-containing protein [Phycisphaeraceae bacterium]